MAEKLYSNHEKLEGLIENLHRNIDTSLDVNRARANFEQMAHNLNAKKDKLKETLAMLENTKNTLDDEMKRRALEEEDLSDCLIDLANERMKIDAKIRESECRMKDIQVEKQKIEVLAQNLEGTLNEMHSKVSRVL